MSLLQTIKDNNKTNINVTVTKYLFMFKGILEDASIILLTMMIMLMVNVIISKYVLTLAIRQTNEMNWRPTTWTHNKRIPSFGMQLCTYIIHVTIFLFIKSLKFMEINYFDKWLKVKISWIITSNRKTNYYVMSNCRHCSYIFFIILMDKNWK